MPARNLFSLATAVAVAFTLAGPAAVAAEENGTTLSVDITLAGARDAPEWSATLALAGERGCSSVEAHRGALAYQVEVCREGGTAAAPVLSFHLSRNDTAGTPRSEKLKVSSQVPSGRRVVVARLAYEQDRGPGLQVIAAIHG